MSDEQIEAISSTSRIASTAAQAGGQVKVIEGDDRLRQLPATALPVLEPPKRRPNRLMKEADTAIGPQERKPKKRKVLLPPGS